MNTVVFCGRSVCLRCCVVKPDVLSSHNKVCHVQFRLRGTSTGHLVHPLLKPGLASTAYLIAQDVLPVSFETFQEWSFHSLPRQDFPAIKCSFHEEFLPYIQLEIFLVAACDCCLCLIKVHYGEDPGSAFIITSL